MKRFAFAFMLLLLVFALPQFAQADITVPPGTGPGIWNPSDDPDESIDPPASTGTLIAAALETAGYKAQEMVLRDLGSMLNSIAALIYTATIIGALVTLSLLGNYKIAAWLLIGPALYHFIITDTVKAAGIDWQFGAFQAGHSDVSAYLPAESRGQAKVAWLFNSYNGLVSSVVQNLITVMSADSRRQQLKFMSRQRILDDILRRPIGTSGLTAVSQFALVHCSREMTAARLVALGNRDPNFKVTSEYKQALEFYNHTYGLSPGETGPPAPTRLLANKSLESPPVFRYIDLVLLPIVEGNRQIEGVPVFEAAGVGEDHEKIIDGYRRGIKLEPRELNGQRTVAGTHVSCTDLWNLMGLGLYYEAYVNLSHAAADNLGFLEKGELDTDEQAALREIINDIAVKLTRPKAALIHRTTSDGKMPEIIEGKVQPDPSLIPVIIGGYMLRRVMTEDIKSKGLTQFNQHTSFKPQPYRYDLSHEEVFSAEQNQDIVAKSAEQQYAEAKQHEIFTIAMLMPYLQGIILYALALSFPFFALLLVIPGKAGGFFTWMALWAWAKSWDVGWAVVMAVDDVLWDLLPHNATYDRIRDPNHGPVAVFEAAFDGDPSYSLSTYYLLVGTMITAVPVLTGRIVLGAKSAMLGIMIDGFRTLGQSYGALMRDWISAENILQENFLRTNRIVGFMSHNRDNIAADFAQGLNPALKEYADFAQATKDHGLELQKEAQGLRAESMGISGLATLARGPGAGLAAFFMGHAVGFALEETGLEQQREGNAQLMMARQINAELNMFDVVQSPQFMQSNARRGGESIRGEHWNLPSAPITARGKIAEQYQKAVLENAETRAGALSTTLRNIKNPISGPTGGL